MNYYGYSEFMIDKLMDMFPLSEVADYCFVYNSFIYVDVSSKGLYLLSQSRMKP